VERSLLFAAIPFFAFFAFFLRLCLFLWHPGSRGVTDEQELVPTGGFRTAITAFQTTATGALKFASTLFEDGSDIYEDFKVTTRAESKSAHRQG
jgi:hypothetical protein